MSLDYPHRLDAMPGMSIATPMASLRALSVVKHRIWDLAALARTLGDEEDSTDEGMAVRCVAVIADTAAERLDDLEKALRAQLGLPEYGFAEPAEQKTKAKKAVRA